MTSFELFEILNLIYFIYSNIILTFYFLKYIQYDKIQHTTFAYKSFIVLFLIA